MARALKSPEVCALPIIPAELVCFITEFSGELSDLVQRFDQLRIAIQEYVEFAD